MTMADSKFSWSEETYRLDELERKVGLPQLIQVTEGIDTGNDIDSFSAEDILMIDRCVMLQKVAAQFAEKKVEIADSGSEYAVLKEEILIPLNYKGKLKVMTPIRRFYGVRDLAREFPRYVTVLDAMRVPTEAGTMMNIQADTKVELDRVIPSQKGEVDRLVVSTEMGGHKQVALPFDAKGKFRSCPDDNEYTLKEVIERYSLPKIIQFLDNKIQKIYTQDLLEGVEQMANVTGSALQINRIVLQKVLIGHYKEPDEIRKPFEKFCKRTLVVIPLDSLGIREITVKIRISDAEDDPIYEPFLVQNVNAKSDYVDMAEGLYVEFVKRPRIIRLKEEEPTQSPGGMVENEEEEEDDEPPPPVPPRPGQPGHGEPPPVKRKPKPNGRPKPKSRAKTGTKVNSAAKNPAKEKNVSDSKLTKTNDSSAKQDKLDELDDNVYEYPENSPVPSNIDYQRGPIRPSPNNSSIALESGPIAFPLADIPFEKVYSICTKQHHYENVKKDQHKEKHVLKVKLTGFFKKKSPLETSEESSTKEKSPPSLQNTETLENSDDDQGNLYDEPDDVASFYVGQTQRKEETHKQQAVISKELTSGGKERPVAFVSPQMHKRHLQPKEFRLLKCDELKERLCICGMPDFAKFCEQEKMDGEFLYGMDKDTLKTLGLSKFNLTKLKKVIAGWIPAR